MEALIVFIIIISALIIYFILNNKKVKSSAVKKDEIINDYKIRMQKVLDINQDNLLKQKEEKTKLLKEINSELSMNLFFDNDDIKKLISELLKMK